MPCYRRDNMYWGCPHYHSAKIMLHGKVVEELGKCCECDIRAACDSYTPADHDWHLSPVTDYVVGKRWYTDEQLDALQEDWEVECAQQRMIDRCESQLERYYGDD